MTTSTGPTATTLADRITALERAYEYMLAYAAQGRRSDTEGNVTSAIRDLLTRASEALDGLTQTTAQQLGVVPASAHEFAGFVKVLQDDARKARAMIGIVLAQPAISSQMVDNLNASTHLRTLLTDLFVINSALKAATAA